MTHCITHRIRSLIFRPFPSHSLCRTDSFLWSIIEMTRSTRFLFLSLSLSLGVSCIFCQKTGGKDIFSWDAGMFLQSLFCVVFAEAYLDLETCEVWAGAMLFSSICSRVAFVQRETLLTEPVVAPERDRKGKREREDQLDVSESSFLTFPVYCICGVVLESVNTRFKFKFCSCVLIACVICSMAQLKFQTIHYRPNVWNNYFWMLLKAVSYAQQGWAFLIKKNRVKK